MKAIAYGHTCALLVPALQELKQQHDVELASMRNEIDELKAMLQQVLQKQQQK